MCITCHQLTAGLPGRAVKFWWFLTFMYGTLVYCTLFGLMVVAISPNLMIAAVVSAAFYSMWNLFAGFILPRPVRPQRHHLASLQAGNLLQNAFLW